MHSNLTSSKFRCSIKLVPPYFYSNALISFNVKKESMIKITNKRKFLIVTLPLLAVIVFGFTVNEEGKYIEGIYNESATTKSYNYEFAHTKISLIDKRARWRGKVVFTQEIFKAIITKNTSDEELEIIKDDLKTNYNIDFSYKVSRNIDNEIVSISITYEGNGNEGSYKVTEKTGIDELTFFIDEEGDAGVSSEAAVKRHKEKLRKKQELMVLKNQPLAENQGSLDSLADLKNTPIEKNLNAGEKNTGIISEQIVTPLITLDIQNEEETNAYEKDLLDTTEPLYFLNGEQIFKKDLKSVPNDNIKEVIVLKGDKAIRKYGDKGANGAVEIILKKQ